MKNIWKDFLFFNQKDKIAIILLLILIAIAGIYSIYLNSLSKIDPSYFIQQEQIDKEFMMYENELETKEIASYNEDIEESPETNISEKEIVKQRKTTNSKLTQGQVININKANFNALLRVPGIGKTLAQRILEYRTELGSFDNIEQLLKIKGITNKKLTQILPYLTLTNKTSNK